jgi:hypothetical protein
VYTTNAIESVNDPIQKIIKHRPSFPNDEAAMKLIFMGLKNISKKWTVPIRDWGAALNHFAVIYGEDRVPYNVPTVYTKKITSEPVPKLIDCALKRTVLDQA